MEQMQEIAASDPTGFTANAELVWRYLLLIGAGIITGFGLIVVWFVRQALNGRLLSLLTPFIAPLIRMVYDSAIMQRLSSKRLPKMVIPRTWQNYLDMPPEFKARLEVYNDTMIMIKELLYGPYSMCQLVARLYQEEFDQQLIRRKRDFQIYAAMVREFMAQIERFEDNLRQQTIKLTESLHNAEDELEACRLELRSWPRWKRWLVRWLRWLYLAKFLSHGTSIASWQKKEKAALKATKQLDKRRNEIAEDLFRTEHRDLMRVGTRLVHFDNSRMSNLMHLLGCAMEDIRATIHSGLVLELLAEDTPHTRKVRDQLGLGPEALPFGFDELRAVTKQLVRERMGSKGQMPREDELEIFLRSRLIDHPRWGHFARYAASSGSIGMSVAKFQFAPPDSSRKAGREGHHIDLNP